MSVVFAIPAPYRKATGGKAEIEVQAENVGQAIAALNAIYPEMGKRLLGENGGLNLYVNVYLNGEQLRRQDALDRPLKDGDRLVIMPVVGGGC